MKARPLIAVYCGSRDGHHPRYKAAATTLGTALAKAGCGLVYGGARVGLMGAVADAVLAGHQPVVGVLPAGLRKKEFAHPGLTELHVVESMHQRKALMEKRASAFIALAGGFGTLDELFEMLTWAQVGLHQKPVGLLNTHGFYDALLQQVAHARREGFVPPSLHSVLVADAQPARLVRRLLTHEVPPAAVIWSKSKNLR